MKLVVVLVGLIALASATYAHESNPSTSVEKYVDFASQESDQPGPLRSYTCVATVTIGPQCAGPHYARGWFEEAVRVRADAACMRAHNWSNCTATCYRD